MTGKALRIVYMGTPDFAAPTLRHLHREGFVIPLVIAQPDRPAGRGRKLTPPAVKRAAQDMGLEVYQPENVNSDEAVEILSGLNPDFLVVAAFGQILKKKVLAIPRLGCVNLHGSLLPKLRGAAPMQRAIMEGHEETGLTTMMMARRMDAGDMLLKHRMAIGPETTLGDLHDALAEAGGALMADTLTRLAAGEITPEKQDEDEATYAPKIESGERAIDWARPAEETDRRIRGLSPVPGAFCTYNGRRLTLLRSRLCGTGSEGEPGRITAVTDDGLEVQTGGGRLMILDVRPEGKKAMTAASWTRGARVTEGDRLE